MSELKGRNQNGGYAQLLAAPVIVFGFFLLYQGFGAAIMQLFGLSQKVDGSIYCANGPENLRLSLILSQMLAALAGLVVVPLLYLKFLRQDLLNELSIFNTPNKGTFALLGMLLLFTAIPMVATLGRWNFDLFKSIASPEVFQKLEKITTTYKEATAVILNINGIADLMMIIFVVAVIPGIGEELIFRGLLQKELAKSINPHVAIFFSAAFFSFIHFDFFGFFPRWYLGILLGYIYLYSGNLYLSMLAHFFNNFIAVITYYFYNKGSIDIDPDAMDKAALPLPLILGSVSITTLLLMRMWRMRVASA